MNQTILETVCLPLCEGNQMIARHFLHTLGGEIPQLNHKTGIDYLDTLPGYGYANPPGRFRLGVATQAETMTNPDRRKGFKARVARLLYELTDKQRFYNAGWVWKSYTTEIETRLNLPILHIMIEVSPDILSSRRAFGWEPIKIHFSGCYDPVNDVLYWDRPSNLRTISNPNNSEGKPNRKPFTFPLTVPEVLSLEKQPEPEPTPEQKKLDYEKWFYSDSPNAYPENPPPDPKPHEPRDFKD